MVNKEAMKLALEALENSVDLVSQEARNAEELYGKYPTRLARIQGLVAFEVAHEKAMNALREALAEQPAQQEPVAMVCHDLDGHIGWNPNLRQLPDEGTALYTSPPAQRTWVGLTDEEIYSVLENLQVMHHRPPTTDSRIVFARAIEAKIKEKNQ